MFRCFCEKSDTFLEKESTLRKIDGKRYGHLQNSGSLRRWDRVSCGQTSEENWKPLEKKKKHVGCPTTSRTHSNVEIGTQMERNHFQLRMAVDKSNDNRGTTD